jgi:hypothetical protein
MSVLVRITDFVPSTLIKSQEMDDELNQLVNLLSGASTTKDTLLKFLDGTNPVLRVDQLGAGVIQQWLQNGAVKTVIDNSGFLYLGKGVIDAAPTAGLISGTGGSGTNIAGAPLDLTGGKGTGNAEPGQLAARYPLRASSGSVLQSLSADRFPLVTALYTNTASGTAVANTTTETSLFTGITASSGSTRTIEAGISAAGTDYRVHLEGSIGTTGTPTMQIRAKFGSTTIADSGLFNAPTNASGVWNFDFIIRVTAIGGSGSVTARARFEGVTGGGVTTPTIVHSNSIASINFTANQTLDVTWQWGTASVSNTATLTGVTIERIR